MTLHHEPALGCPPHTVPCVWGCGYLATDEPDLDAHELACEHESVVESDTAADEDVTVAGLADAVVDLGRLALAFGRINRTAVYHPDRVTPESDTDHTVMLGWVACALAAHCVPHLDVGLVAQFALVHDAPEVYAGDTPTLRITPTEQAAKADREHQATRRLTSEFAARLPWFPAAISTYETQHVPEARFVRGVDKILPKIVHLLDGCVGLVDRGITSTDMAQICATQRQAMAGYVGEFTDVLALHATVADRVISRPELTHQRQPATTPASVLNGGTIR